MPVLEWFRAYVERLLAEAWDMERLTPDQDGDYPFRFGTAVCFVRIEQGPPLAIRVVAQAASGVRRSAKLLTELNELNASARSVSTYWFEGAVYVDRAVDAAGVNADTLLGACTEVGRAADNIGALIAGVYDGHTPFQPVPVDEESA